MADRQEPVKVTVSDPVTGEVLGEQIVKDDYVIICAGTCHVDGMQIHANGTNVITVKGRKG
jgi:hypothetical protein